MTTPLCLILGAPRSGTTWVQTTLASHPAIASPQETHVFQDYLVPAWNRWQLRTAERDRVVSQLASGRPPTKRLIGLPTLLDEEEFIAALRPLVAVTRDHALRGKPGSEIVLEKTPTNTLHIDMIEALCPGTVYVHVVRHPFDVVRSLLNISPEWGGGWAPTTVRSAARYWAMYVEHARHARAVAPDRYLEVRYEDLVADADDAFRAILEFIGAKCDVSIDAQAINDVAGGTIDALIYSDRVRGALGGTAVREPPDFRSPRPQLSARQRRAVESVVATTMGSCGYLVRDERAATAPRQRLANRIDRWREMRTARWGRVA